MSALAQGSRIGIGMGGGDSKHEGLWVGQSVPRVEDAALLTGRGRFVDDIDVPGCLHVALVRSSIPSGEVEDIDRSAVIGMPGVRQVVTAKDLHGVPGIRAQLHRSGYVETEMPLLAGERIRHAGEPIALVIADSPYVAEDAVDLMRIKYRERPWVTNIDDAQSEGAPLVHDEVAGNVVMDTGVTGDENIDTLLREAHITVEGTFTAGRITAAPLECKGVLAYWDAREDRLVVYATTQTPYLLRSVLASTTGLSEHMIRVIAPDIGGSFGQKGVIGREEVILGLLATRIRRPMKWVQDRRENLAYDFSGHEQRHHVVAAFDEQGTLLGVSADIETDVGAYSCFPITAALEPLMAMAETPGPFRFSRYSVRARGVMTNKPTASAYRGVSRPHATFTMERLMDKAARQLQISRAEIRKRNLLTDDDFPYATPAGLSIDKGSYQEALQVCLDSLDFEGWPKHQANARAEGRLLGLGVASFAERTGFGTSVFAARGLGITIGFDTAVVRMDPSGGVTGLVGVSAHGQGARTTLAQVIADELGVDFSAVRIVQGDTDQSSFGWGSIASRSAVIAGGACKRAARTLQAKIMRIAAHQLEVNLDDLEMSGGHVSVRGDPDISMAITEIAKLAHHQAHRLDGEEPGLEATATFDPPGTFSNQAHGVIVEVDPQTGGVSLHRYVAVEDCGVALNPMIVDGQVAGGVAQGIAKALYERLWFDDSGQCVSSTFMDYLMPTATEIPPIEIHHLETPCAYTETGAKGTGEGGAIGPAAVIANAVSDALTPWGFEADELPITPESILRALQGPLLEAPP